MYKAYYYEPHHLGMEKFPEGLTRLDTDYFEHTDDPDKADVYVVPAGFHAVSDKVLYQLPYMEDAAERHVLLNVSDSYRRPVDRRMMIFRCDTTKWIYDQNPFTIPLAWPVEDLTRYMHPYDIGYDIGFYGWASTELGRKATQLLGKDGRFTTNFTEYMDFYGYLSKEEQDRRRAPFIENMRTAKLALCVRSIPSGVIRYRFFEALSMGRVPLHINDGCVYPFADRIDYRQCTVMVTENAVHNKSLADCANNVIGGTTRDEMQLAGEYGSAMWKQYLDSTHWPTRMALECKRILEEEL